MTDHGSTGHSQVSQGSARSPERVAAVLSAMVIVGILAVVTVGGLRGGAADTTSGPTPIDSAAASESPSSTPVATSSAPDISTLDLRAAAVFDERLATLGSDLQAAVAKAPPDVGVISTTLRSINAVVVSGAGTVQRLQRSVPTATLGHDLGAAYAAIGEAVSKTLSLSLSNGAGYVAGAKSTIKSLEALAPIDARIDQALAVPSPTATG